MTFHKDGHQYTINIKQPLSELCKLTNSKSPGSNLSPLDVTAGVIACFKFRRALRYVFFYSL